MGGSGDREAIARRRGAAAWALGLAGLSTAGLGGVAAEEVVQRCAGRLHLGGVGALEVVAAKFNEPGHAGGPLSADVFGVQVAMNGRGYLADSCSACGGPGAAFMSTGCPEERRWTYDRFEYSALELVGKSLTYSVDLSGSHCGCNAALYFVSMRQNTDASKCADYYCDANEVCGVRCTEIDLQEANRHAWYTTLHTSTDGDGVGKGLGKSRHAWSTADYGPGGRCIDTARPFDVEARFPVDGIGELTAMEVKLTQPGSPCPLSIRLSDYIAGGANGWEQVKSALRAGVTPVVSFWGAKKDMEWLDDDVCKQDDSGQCASVRFYNFALTPLSPMGPPPTAAPSTAAPTAAPAVVSRPQPGPAKHHAEPAPPKPQLLPQSHAAPAPAPAAASGSPLSSVWVWLCAPAIGLAALLALTCMGEGAQQRERQVGDKVLAKRRFQVQGRFWGHATIETATKGKVDKVEDNGDVIVSFEKHFGQFRITESQMRSVQIWGEASTRRSLLDELGEVDCLGKNCHRGR